MYLSEAVLSNTWFTVTFRQTDEKLERAFALWLNSSLGVLNLVFSRVPTEGAWTQFKKANLAFLPVLDFSKLNENQLNQLATGFDEICLDTLQSLPDMANDPTRAKIDDTLSAILKIPDLHPLRVLLAREPVVCNRSLLLDAASKTAQVLDVM